MMPPPASHFVPQQGQGRGGMLQGQGVAMPPPALQMSWPSEAAIREGYANSVVQLPMQLPMPTQLFAHLWDLRPTRTISPLKPPLQPSMQQRLPGGMRQVPDPARSTGA